MTSAGVSTSTPLASELPAHHRADVRRLYVAFPIMGLALSVVTASQFLDLILLRLGLNMQQFGIIKGLGLCLPLAANLLLAPLVMRLDADRWVAGIGHLVRVAISFVFLWLPHLTRDRSMLTIAYTITYIVWMMFPTLANNSLFVLCKEVFPASALGKHMSYISALWTLPGPFAAIVAGWYVGRHAGGSDEEFFRAMFWAFFWTSVCILPSSILMMRIRSGRRREEDVAAGNVGFASVIEPFRSREFRAVLKLIFALTTVTAMITSFMYPYLLQAQKMSLWQISVVDAIVSVLGLPAAMLWSRLIDRFGGSNALRIATLGMAIGVFCFTGSGWVFVALYALLAWGSERGIFGTASAIAQRYLMLSQGEARRTHVYVAAVTFVSGFGYLAGGIGGGTLLQWLQSHTRADLPYAHFKIYFAYCALAYLLMGDLIGSIKEDRKRVSSVEMAIELARALRGLATRSR